MKLLDYFDRVFIIHLREREDRYLSLVRELRRLGIDIKDKKISIPNAVKSDEAHGFPSKGVYGNFLSHLEILKRAQRDHLGSVWVLEDDAIFSRRFVHEQKYLADHLANNEWDMCYFGHSLTKELDKLEVGLPRFSQPFYWAHCYAVHARILPRLISYLESTLDNPLGDRRGSRMYIDAAYTLFRKFNPDVVTLVANPVLSLQRGSPSSLSDQNWYDKQYLIRPTLKLARALRDECWRWTGWTIGGAAPRSLHNVSDTQ